MVERPLEYISDTTHFIMLLITNVILTSFLITSAPKISEATFQKLDFKDKVEILSESYGINEDLAHAIIDCESEGDPEAVNKNRDRKGNVWSRDYGYWQVNDYWHAKEAKKLGLDITDPDDNLIYGFYLLKRDGTKHWNASRARWEPMLREDLPSCPKR